MRVYVTEKHKEAAKDFASQGEREYLYMSGIFGQPESSRINLVELPDDAVSAAWAPEIAAIAGNRITARNEQRLLANTLAHQWWGNEVSPATMNDAWITNGMSRYAELMYLEDSAGKTAFQHAIGDVSAGALAYDTEPLTTLGRLDPFSPQFQSMTLEKGAMVFHMLRWEMGDEVFHKFLRGLLSQYTDKSIRTSNVADCRRSAPRTSSSTPSSPSGSTAPARPPSPTSTPSSASATTRASAPSAASIRTSTSSACRSSCASKPTARPKSAASTSPAPTRTTPSRPSAARAASASIPRTGCSRARPISPSSVAVLRGQQQVAQGDLTAALVEYQKALDANKNSSLAAYRIGEIFFMQRNFQSAANSFRDALRGDNDPKWAEVWSHIELGRIFDVTGQRDRAVNEYRLAVQTNDNTQGAVNEARAPMQTPYKCQRNEN